MVKRKKAKMGINQVNHLGNLFTNDNDIENSVINFFIDLFVDGSPSPLDSPTLSMPASAVNVHQNELLCRLSDLDELKQVVFGLKPNSAPGLDGFTGNFFKVAGT